MSKKIQFRPDYARLYPGVEISPELLDYLKKSDARMEYEDSHRKRERPVRDENGKIAAILPSREDSFERLLETGAVFTDEASDPESLLIAAEDKEELRRALNALTDDERALIDALFYGDMTERGYAGVLGIAQKNVNKKKQRVLVKLKKILAG